MRFVSAVFSSSRFLSSRPCSPKKLQASLLVGVLSISCLITACPSTTQDTQNTQNTQNLQNNTQNNDGKNKDNKENKDKNKNTTKNTVDNSAVLAQIGSQKITAQQLTEKINEQSPYVRAKFNNDDEKKKLLDNLVRFEVLAAEAKKRGYDNDPDVQRLIKQMLVEKITRDIADELVHSNEISDDELRKYYESHMDEYAQDDTYRLSVVITADKAKAVDAQKKIAGLKPATDRNALGKIIAAASEDKDTKDRGGDTNYVTGKMIRERFGESVEKAVLNLRTPEDVSPVVEGKAADDKPAYFVIKLTGQRPAFKRDFEQVKGQIRNVVYREKRGAAFEAHVEKLNKDQNVQVFADKLGEVKISAPPADLQQKLQQAPQQSPPQVPQVPQVPQQNQKQNQKTEAGK